MKSEKAPTFEEFHKVVKEKFKQYWSLLPDEEAERYLESEIDYIRRGYAASLKRFESGEIDYKTFLVGCAVADAHCLEMMY